MTTSMQLSMFEADNEIYDKEQALLNIRKLYAMWKNGKLGGKFMPEDSNPQLKKSQEENYIYFTLPMALNYQRNSYILWEAALKTFNDRSTSYLFYPEQVVERSREYIQRDLLKHKLALQPNKHTDIWITLCNTIVNNLGGCIKNLFKECDYSVENILNEIQIKNKKNYPYLSGNKIANYWLYVMINYTDLVLLDRHKINVAPDTHIIQASQKLGLIDADLSGSVAQKAAVDSWEQILKDTEFSPIDIHTPMWLWSRGGFIPIED